MKNRMFGIIIFIICIIPSLAYAGMNYITIEDASNHDKIAKVINKLIDRANQDKENDKNDKKEFRQINKYLIGVNDKVAKKMIAKGWIAQHSEVEP